MRDLGFLVFCVCSFPTHSPLITPLSNDVLVLSFFFPFPFPSFSLAPLPLPLLFLLFSFPAGMENEKGGDGLPVD